jgi:tellurite resistance protein/DNA-binding phage protein
MEGRMADREFMDDRRRASEEDYFRRKDKELVEKMRQAAAAEKATSEFSAKTGLSDPVLIQELQALGFTPETLSVLPLVPIVEMAWAEGGITPAERQLLISLARERGITDGSPADRLLAEWMSAQPRPDEFSRATRLIRAMLETGAAGGNTPSAEDLIKYCESIAAASGGIFGIGKISGEERATLAKIAEELKGRR